MRVILVVAMLAGTAHADPAAEVAKTFDSVMSLEAKRDADLKLPRFAMSLDSIDTASGTAGTAEDWYMLLLPLPGRSKVIQPIAGVAADGKAAWIAADLAIIQACETIATKPSPAGGTNAAEYCFKGDPKAWLHGAALFELDGQRWQPVAWHVAGRRPGAASADATLGHLDGKIEPDAADAVKALDSALGDPKQLGALVADRDGVAMIGSDKGERYAGATAVRKMLATWGLAFTPIDRQAGVTASKSVAWVAEHVRAGKKGAKDTTYRVLALLERTTAGWKLVQLTFAATGAGK